MMKILFIRHDKILLYREHWYLYDNLYFAYGAYKDKEEYVMPIAHFHGSQGLINTDIKEGLRAIKECAAYVNIVDQESR